MRFWSKKLGRRFPFITGWTITFGKQPQTFYYARISAVRWAGLEAGETHDRRNQRLAEQD